MRFVAAFVIDGARPDLNAQLGLTWDTIAAGRWAVFRHVGPYETLSKTWRAIFGEWLPGSGRNEAPAKLCRGGLSMSRLRCPIP